MTFKELERSICDEIKNNLENIDDGQIEEFIEYILEIRKNNKRLFVIGAGRAMLIGKAFAKRLEHIGIDTYIVGGTTSPPISENDLLIVVSGSGETSTSLNIARLAGKFKAKVVSVTTSESSSLAKISNIYLKIPGPNKLQSGESINSIQPMANLFEQSLFIVFDCMSIMIQKKLNVSNEEMLARHANLE